MKAVIATLDNTIGEVTVYNSGVPGLILWNNKEKWNEFGKPKYPWRVVHAESGKPFGFGWRLKTEAKEFAMQLGTLADWLCSEDELWPRREELMKAAFDIGMELLHDFYDIDLTK